MVDLFWQTSQNNLYPLARVRVVCTVKGGAVGGARVSGAARGTVESAQPLIKHWTTAVVRNACFEHSGEFVDGSAGLLHLTDQFQPGGNGVRRQHQDVPIL